MCLVTKSLKYDKQKIANNLISIIKSTIAIDLAGTDTIKLDTQMKTLTNQRMKLIDIYISGDITKEEFTLAHSKCNAEISQLQSVIDNMDKRQTIVKQQQELMYEIMEVINELLGGVEYEDEFYKYLLDKMVVQDRNNIDVYLNFLSTKWSYTLLKTNPNI